MTTEVTKGQAGRPPKYDDAVQASADYYMLNWKELGDSIPSRVGLCCYIGIAKSTSYEWEGKYPRFSDTLKAIDALQEHAAINKGITGEFNSTITKLVLANHGYHEKSDVSHSSPDGTMTPARVDSTLIEALAKKLTE